jgi:hypothetical protein
MSRRTAPSYGFPWRLAEPWRHWGVKSVAAADGITHLDTNYLLASQRLWYMAFTPDKKYLLTTNGGAARLRRVGDGMRMDDDEVVDREDVLYVYVHVGGTGAQDLGQLPDALGTVGQRRIVLLVVQREELGGRIEILVVERSLIEAEHGVFVRLDLGGGLG